MNIRSLLVLSAFAFIAASCSNQTSESSSSDSVSASLASNEISPDSTIISFLKWYRDNEDNLSNHSIVKGGYPDTTSNYEVDFTNAEKFLSQLKASTFLSDAYLNDLRRHFTESNEHLKREPQNDGPAWGFDADLVMKAQDFTDVWANLDKAKVLEKNIKGDSAAIKLNFAGNYNTRYALSKHNGRWLIDNIENAFDEN